MSAWPVGNMSHSRTEVAFRHIIMQSKCWIFQKWNQTSPLDLIQSAVPGSVGLFLEGGKKDAGLCMILCGDAVAPFLYAFIYVMKGWL